MIHDITSRKPTFKVHKSKKHTRISRQVMRHQTSNYGWVGLLKLKCKETQYMIHLTETHILDGDIYFQISNFQYGQNFPSRSEMQNKWMLSVGILQNGIDCDTLWSIS